MLKITCKSEGCSRKVERGSLAGLCPPCSHAFKSAEAQLQRRTEQRADSLDRRGDARSSQFTGNRVIPPPPAPGRAAPAIDVDKLYDTYDNMSSENSTMKDMFGMLLNLSLKGQETEEIKTQLSENTHRLCRLEAKIGNPDDFAVPLSLAVRNIPLPAPGITDLQLIIAAFREIPHTNVDLDRDIVRVERRGATDANLGTVFVEMSSDQTRASIMKNKKHLESHQNPGIRKIIIKNMMERSELKMNIALNEILRRIPGSENCYVANNGHIREKNPNQRPNNLQYNQNTNTNQFNPNPNHGPRNPHYLNQQRPTHHQPQGYQSPARNTTPENFSFQTRAPIIPSTSATGFSFPAMAPMPTVSAPWYSVPLPTSSVSAPAVSAPVSAPHPPPPVTPVFQFTGSSQASMSSASFDQLVSAAPAPVMATEHGSGSAAPQHPGQGAGGSQGASGSQSPGQAGHVIGQTGQSSQQMGASGNSGPSQQ